MVATARTPLLGPFSVGLLVRSASSAPHLPGLLIGSPDLGNPQRQASAMPIDPTDLAKSIGAVGSLDPERGLAPTLQQIADAAKQLARARASQAKDREL